MKAIVVLWAGLAIAGTIGWVSNIITLIGMVDGEITTMFILRVVGIFFAPLGCVLGYF